MPNRIPKVVEQLSVGSVTQNALFYSLLTIMFSMIVVQHVEISARSRRRKERKRTNEDVK